MADFTLSNSTAVGSNIRHLTFLETPESYSTPGQFLAVQLGEHKPAWFVIASDPGQPLELLVKRGGAVSDELCELPIGGIASAAAAMGDGFDLPASARPLVCLINGTGIAAVRPVINAEIAAGLPRSIHLIYGVHSEQDIAFFADLQAWGARGVQVLTTVGSGGGDWNGPRGWVQEHAERLGLVRADVDVLLCGVKDMAIDVRARYANAELPENQLHTNF